MLWASYDPARLSAPASAALTDGGQPIYFSFASVWEIAIKLSLKKLGLPQPLAVFVNELRQRGWQYLPLQVADALAVAELPHHHGDPFDRILIAQARGRRLAVITRDPGFRDYDVKVVW